MKRYKVVLSPRAFRQLGEIERWIEENGDPTVARRYRQAIVDHCFGLEQFPERGRPRDDLRAGMRTTVFSRSGDGRLCYSGRRVQIIAVVGRGRDIGTALKD